MKQKTQSKVLDEENEIETTEENGKNESTINETSITTAIDQFNFTEEERKKGTFKNFKISKKIIKKLKARGVEFLFPVQSESYNFIYEKKDCIVQARTGTGKTLAFSIPIVELLESQETDKLERGRSPRVLVLAPTRELTKQISDDFSTIVTTLSVVTIYGGKKYDQQEGGLRAGCDIIVATPGRLLDFISNGKISLANIQHVVLDEVDRMLDMGFKDSVDEILSYAFTSETTEKPQMIVFSATIPDWIKQATKKYLSGGKYEMIDLIKDSKQKTATNVEHLAIASTYQDRANIIESLLQVYSGQDGRAIVFCETKKEADELSVSHDIKAESHVLHGDIPQDKREMVLKKFREGKYRLLITTDVAARGLDIPEVDLVVVTAPPKDVEAYIHRSGRTGRAGGKGICICLYKSTQTYDLQGVENQAGIKFKRVTAPSVNEVMSSSSADAVKSLDDVTEEAKAHFRTAAEQILVKRDAVDALSAALACIAGTTTIVARSLLSHRENYTTYMMSVQDEFQGVGLVFTTLRRCFGDEFDAKSNCSKIAFTKDMKNAVFDLPSELDETLQGYWKDSPRLQLKTITELPELDESSMNGGGNEYGSRGGGGRGQRGGGSRGGRGGRNSDRPSNACFNCGQTGHMSRECTEPKSGGGRQSNGQSNACYNCGQTGHMSRECTEPKTGGGRPSSNGQSNVCFNCQQPGHMSRECTEPKKFGGQRGGRGGFGGGRGGGQKRSFDYSSTTNGSATNGSSNKKVKFDSDGED